MPILTDLLRKEKAELAAYDAEVRAEKKRNYNKTGFPPEEMPYVRNANPEWLASVDKNTLLTFSLEKDVPLKMLRAMASKFKVEGRSKMNKAALAKALLATKREARLSSLEMTFRSFPIVDLRAELDSVEEGLAARLERAGKVHIAKLNIKNAKFAAMRDKTLPMCLEQYGVRDLREAAVAAGINPNGLTKQQLCKRLKPRVLSGEAWIRRKSKEAGCREGTLAEVRARGQREGVRGYAAMTKRDLCRQFK